ncbi:MAG TPA: recombinase family protein, partial [Acholeplasmataceae bacterium]|nr:recombinase family protein [Acholeplasmataceae bacterium]
MCAYARVSTDTEDQINSYNAQISEYTSQIKENNDWEFVNMYADEGISGTSTKKRVNFLRMIDDAKAGKIDLILVKSLSRFARNTVDCLSIIQELRTINVEVFFEKENISSSDSKVDFMMTIFSSIAQEEARNISENVKWGIRKRYKDGNIRINTSRFLGYDKDEKGKIVINSDEAKIVKMIFNLYLSGMSYREISTLLVENNIKNGRNEIIWHPANIMHILKNEKYCGDVLLQKRVTLDYLTHKSVINKGQAPQYYIENNHEPIISRELFQVVQQTLKNRSKNNESSRYGNQFPLSGMVVCGCCNRVLNRNYYNYRTEKERVVLTCKNTSKERIQCDNLPIDNQTLEMVCSDVLMKLNQSSNSLIDDLVSSITKHFDSSKLIESIKEANQDIAVKENEIRSLINLRISDVHNINDSYLIKAFEEKKHEIEDLQERLSEFQNQLATLHVNNERISKLKAFLENDITLSRDALFMVIKKIKQVSSTEVVIYVDSNTLTLDESTVINP